LKIFVLAVDPLLQPSSQPFIYPPHSTDYGVEQDFLAWLQAHPEYIADDARTSDWHYLPVFWTRWHLDHDYGRHRRDELAALTAKSILDDRRTFTVCQYDDGPLVDLGTALVCLASRKTGDGLDIPLLSAPHRGPLFPVRRRYLASFVGRLDTHPVRAQLAASLRGRRDVRIVDSARGTRRFVRLTRASSIALAPRGYGGSSFRFFEAAQLGTVPMLVGDLDTRPFKHAIDWSAISLYARDDVEAVRLLDAAERRTLERMGHEAARVWREELTYGHWCNHLYSALQASARGPY
jgi:hypothetical protein